MADPNVHAETGIKAPAEIEAAHVAKINRPDSQKEIIPRSSADLQRDPSIMETHAELTSLDESETRSYAGARLEEMAYQMKDGEIEVSGDVNKKVDQHLAAAELINSLPKDGSAAEIVDAMLNELKQKKEKAESTGSPKPVLDRIENELQIALNASSVLYEAADELSDAVEDEASTYASVGNKNVASDYADAARRLVLNGHVREHNERVKRNASRRQPDTLAA